MEISEYTYTVDTLMEGTLHNRILSLQTANGTRFDFFALNKMSKSISQLRYSITEDRDNGMVLVNSLSDESIQYVLPIAAIELITRRLPTPPSAGSIFIDTIGVSVTNTSHEGDAVFQYQLPDTATAVLVEHGANEYLSLDEDSSFVTLTKAGEEALANGLKTIKFTINASNLGETSSVTYTVCVA